MNLRKKILLASSGMIAGALILLLLIGGMVLHSFSRRFDPVPPQRQGPGIDQKMGQQQFDEEQVREFQKEQMEKVLVTFLIVGVIAIGVIVMTSQVFTHFIAKGIMKPVNALEDGAKRIKSGDLSTPIAYQGSDEFATVCSAFNQMQSHLQKEQELNAAYEKARTDMITGISHDLRTPLTSIKGYIKGIQDGVATTPEKLEQYLSIAYRKACDMDVLLQKLFYFSKMETGNLLLNLEKTDLAEFAQRFARDIAAEFEQKHVTSQVFCEAGPHYVQLDEEQMYRVLGNLIANACKYAKAPELVITIRVWREMGTEYLSVADNGVGVPEDQIGHLFEQFWRADEARSSQNEQGSGLGLYIVKYIIEAHRGTITARNDHGLRFDIAFPKAGEEVHV